MEKKRKKPVVGVRVGKTQQKILLLLWSGLAIGLSGSPKTTWRVIRAVHKEWKEIDRKALNQSIGTLYDSGLVTVRTDNDGSKILTLSDEGKKRAIGYALKNLTIKHPARWDNHWRIVMFDIPEELRRARNSFRFQMQRLGFIELQKSVFIHPYPCGEEIKYLSDFYHVRKFVRLVVAMSVDNEQKLKRSFGLNK